MEFTDWLYELQIDPNDNWVLMGDFNFIRSMENRNRPGENTDDMLLFNDVIRVLELVEIPIKGTSFTWSNMQDSPLLEQRRRQNLGRNGIQSTVHLGSTSLLRTCSGLGLTSHFCSTSMSLRVEGGVNNDGNHLIDVRYHLIQYLM